VLLESEEKVCLGFEEDRIKLEEKRNQVRLINEFTRSFNRIQAHPFTSQEKFSNISFI